MHKTSRFFNFEKAKLQIDFCSKGNGLPWQLDEQRIIISHKNRWQALIFSVRSIHWHNYQEHKENGQLIPFWDMKLLYNRTATFALFLQPIVWILCFQRSWTAQCKEPLTKTLVVFLHLLADWFTSNHSFLLNVPPSFQCRRIVKGMDLIVTFLILLCKGTDQCLIGRCLHYLYTVPKLIYRVLFVLCWF